MDVFDHGGTFGPEVQNITHPALDKLARKVYVTGTMADSIEHIREMHDVLPRGPWGIIAQEAITTLLAEIDRLHEAIDGLDQTQWEIIVRFLGREAKEYENDEEDYIREYAIVWEDLVAGVEALAKIAKGERC